jgi:hypothetical protein
MSEITTTEPENTSDTINTSVEVENESASGEVINLTSPPPAATSTTNHQAQTADSNENTTAAITVVTDTLIEENDNNNNVQSDRIENNSGSAPESKNETEEARADKIHPDDQITAEEASNSDTTETTADADNAEASATVINLDEVTQSPAEDHHGAAHSREDSNAMNHLGNDLYVLHFNATESNVPSLAHSRRQSVSSTGSDINDIQFHESQEPQEINNINTATENNQSNNSNPVSPRRKPNFPAPPTSSKPNFPVPPPRRPTDFTAPSTILPSGPKPPLPPPRVHSLGHNSSHSSDSSDSTHRRRPSSGSSLDSATVLHYLRQAFQAGELPALNDLLAKAEELGIRDPLVDSARIKHQELTQQKLNDDVNSFKYYLKQAIEGKNYFTLHNTLEKCEQTQQKLYQNSATRKLNSDFFSLIDEAKQLLHNLAVPAVESCHYYLNVAINSKNKDLLKESLMKTTQLHSSGLLDVELVHRAEFLLRQLDAESLALFYLGSAVKLRDDSALEEAIKQCNKLSMSPATHPQIIEATHFLAQLRNKNKEKLEKHKKNRNSISNTAKDFFGFNKNKAKLQQQNSFQLFNCTLQAAVAHSKPLLLPRVLIETVIYLSENGLKEPGLFRIAGNKDLIEVLRAEYESEVEVKHSDLHDCSGVLKLFLRKLTEPLLTFDLYTQFISVGSDRKLESRIATLNLLISRLPQENQLCLEYLMRFLHRITQFSEVNKMTADNLAIVFAPNILRPKENSDSLAVMQEMQPSISCVSTIIAEINQLFGVEPSERCKIVLNNGTRALPQLPKAPGSKNNSLDNKKTL